FLSVSHSVSVSCFLLVLYCFAHHLDLHSFPTRRSSDLSTRSTVRPRPSRNACSSPATSAATAPAGGDSMTAPGPVGTDAGGSRTDRKSTRLNSSHVKISYAVFCLKKKKKNN